MNRSTLDRLHDIVEAAELVTQHVGDLDPPGLSQNLLARDAALFRLAVLCEAANHLPSEIKALAPAIRWRAMRAMRTHIVHSYWQIDLVIVVQVVAKDIPPLIDAAHRLMSLTPPDAP